MDQLKTLFSFKGRASRVAYWRRQRLIAVTAMVVWLAMIFLTLAGRPGILIAPLFIPILAIGLAITFRRLQDRNKGLVWLAVFLIGPYAFYAMAEVLAEQGDAGALASLPFAIAGLGLTLWFIVEVWFLRGTKGENRFGPEPARIGN